jgi:putative phage-type endonuclease
MNRLLFEFLENVEEYHPLGAHAKFQDPWIKDVRSFAEESGILETDDDKKTLDLAIYLRCLTHDAAVGGTEAAVLAGDSSWKWLLTVKQVEQRTMEWYLETRNLLTASEVSVVFKPGRTRGSLVMAKAAPPPETPPERFSSSLAVERRNTGPMDWGVRYEPVVKEHLEKTLGCKIHDLGRIRHRTDPHIAASPDGLIVSCERDHSLVGRLIEIKCPSTRVIKDGIIPFDYWCQMQLQMEVCGVDACEFVEVKFREYGLDEPAAEPADKPAAEPKADEPADKPAEQESIASGIISLVANTDTFANHYVYGDFCESGDSLALVEKYGWEIVKLRRVTVMRDVNWFSKSQPDFDAFWRDVALAREGKWTLPPGRPKKVKVVPLVCGFVDDSDTPQALTNSVNGAEQLSGSS